MNEQVADWIQVDESKYNKIKQSSAGLDSRTVIIEMSLSPYEVPNQVRGDYDDDAKKFVIDFKYIDSEDLVPLDIDKHMSAFVGRRSGRLYSLLIDIDAMGAEAIELKIKEEDVHKGAEAAFKKLAAAVSSGFSHNSYGAPNTQNYGVAEKVVADYWPGISQELVGAN